MKEKIISLKLKELSKSSFRSSFHLKDKELAYLEKNGFKTIEKHAKDFVKKRLAMKNPLNDGKQTPVKGHPVFIAMHATATCCRGCLNKWHKISKDKELSENEQNYIVYIIMAWLLKEYKEKRI